MVEMPPSEKEEQGMKTWKKVLIGSVSALTLGGGANWAAQAASPSKAKVEDVRGPCDEAEHANHPQCAAAQAREDNGRGEDVLGREAEQGDDRGQDREAEGADDNSGPSENAGTSDDSGREDPSG